MPSIRTFIAFDTPPGIRKEMSDLQSRLRKSGADVRWESPEKFHATIKFLGDVEETQLPGVLAKIRETGGLHRSFEIVYKSVGGFPDVTNPRVVWIGCENPDGRLLLLKNALDTALLPYGFEIEARPFHPHITLGRVKSTRGKFDLTSMIEKVTLEPRVAAVAEIIVVKSALRPQGAEYTVVQNITLQP
jgi:2'-5' RNA ligase